MTTYESSFLDYIKKNKKFESEQDDRKAKDFLESHYDTYTDILNVYTDYCKKNLSLKIGNKKCFYYFSLILLCIIISISFIMISILLFVQVNHNLEIIIGLIGTIITSVITIPNIIAKYLFNIEEEKYISDIINHIQNYDNSVRDHLSLKK